MSGQRDLNPRPLAPHASALARLRHAPRDCISTKVNFSQYSTISCKIKGDFQSGSECCGMMKEERTRLTAMAACAG
jgi:hypothetical protein